MPNAKRILYVGPLNFGSTCKQRMSAFRSLGIDTIPINTFIKNRMLNKICHSAGVDLRHFNKKLVDETKTNSPDLIWIDKGLLIKRKTLEYIKKSFANIILVSYSPDDMLNPNNQSKHYLDSIPLYDYHVTTKSFNIRELKNLGAQEVMFVNNSFDPETHKPIDLTKEEKEKLSADVGFIGQYEKERFETIMWLVQQGVKITIRGYNWPKVRNKNIKIINQAVWGVDYAKTICATRINLCFLRKVNRDLQTTRSVEIPACGGFMIAEKTNEHLSLFKEDEEAVFFSSENELLDKIRYYLKYSDSREKIAKNGYKRCLTNGYSNIEVLDKVMKTIFV